MAEPNPQHTSLYNLTVRFCETDLMGIVHHASYLVYFEAGRVDWLARRGLTYTTCIERGFHLPVVETRLRYKKAARFEDRLTVETTRQEITRLTVKFACRVLRGEELLCEGDTLLACVGKDLTLAPFPEDIAAILDGPEVVATPA